MTTALGAPEPGSGSDHAAPRDCLGERPRPPRGRRRATHAGTTSTRRRGASTQSLKGRDDVLAPRVGNPSHSTQGHVTPESTSLRNYTCTAAVQLILVAVDSSRRSRSLKPAGFCRVQRRNGLKLTSSPRSARAGRPCPAAGRTSSARLLDVAIHCQPERSGPRLHESAIAACESSVHVNRGASATERRRTGRRPAGRTRTGLRGGRDRRPTGASPRRASGQKRPTTSRRTSRIGCGFTKWTAHASTPGYLRRRLPELLQAPISCRRVRCERKYPFEYISSECPSEV